MLLVSKFSRFYPKVVTRFLKTIGSDAGVLLYSLHIAFNSELFHLRAGSEKTPHVGV